MTEIVLKRNIIELGRSLAVTIPQEIVELFKITKKHTAHFTVNNDKVILEFKKKVEKKK